MLGSANITGGKLFHIMSGNLSHQIEHHLFPDIPARRYPQIAPEVKALCEKYGLPYNTGRLSKQLGSVYGEDLPAGAAVRPQEGRPRRRRCRDRPERGHRGGLSEEDDAWIGRFEIAKDTAQVLTESAADARRPDRDDPDRRGPRGRARARRVGQRRVRDARRRRRPRPTAAATDD